jgi:transmembrane sensor
VNQKITEISYLLLRHLRGELNEEERQTLENWVTANEGNRQLFSEINDEKQLAATLAHYMAVDTNRVEAKIRQQLADDTEKIDTSFTRPVHRVHFLKQSWWKYAAAIIILFGAGTYLYIHNQNEKPSVTQNNPVPVQNDVAPGGNRATLTLADGSKIVLDSAKSGELAREENATITKTADGKIVYDPNEKLADKILFNTMATPRGGQYQLTLPDGSQVWLNAESSITYPTAFPGSERKVSITGEAYFEVAHNAKQPFRVETGSQMVEVLGTHFNINAYKEEPTINTTLLEGSIRLSSTFVHTSLILKPGQQGQLAENKLTLAAKPDVEQVMAWKNGAFNFENLPLATALREIARWYDVEVIYSNGIPQVTLGGGMGRDLNLSQVLKALQYFDVDARLENRKLYISQ